MAIAPPNEDAFLREVDDELRKEQLTGFWKRWGRWLVLGLVLALAALAGFLYWQQQRAAKAGERSEQLTQALQQLSGGSPSSADPALAALAAEGGPAYSAAARLTQAGVQITRDDQKAAAATLAALVADGKVPQPIRDLALVRQTGIEFDTLPPQTVIQRLQPLAVAGGPWFGSAGEMIAIAHLKLNQPAKAGALFAAIAKERDVPETLRSRALKMAGALGVDAVLPTPATPKE